MKIFGIELVGNIQTNPTSSIQGGITGSLFGTSSVSINSNTASYTISSSYALTSSYAENAGQGSNYWTASAGSTISRNSNVNITGSFDISGSLLAKIQSLEVSGNINVTGSLKVLGGITGSLLGTSSYATLALTSNTASYYIETDPIFTAVSSSYTLNSQTGSLVKNSQTSSMSVLSSSYALTASLLLGSIESSSYALTASYASNVGQGSNYWTASGADISRNSNVIVTGSLYVTGTISITIDELSISGSEYITGSLKVLGGITGSLLGTSSYATLALTSNTASYYGGSVVSASYAATASLLLGSIESSSYALTASYASNAGQGSNYWTASVGDSINRSGDVTITGSLSITGSNTTLIVERQSIGAALIVKNQGNIVGGPSALLVSDGTYEFGIGWNGGTNSGFVMDANGLHIFSNVNNLILDPVNNVGIRTATPDATLHVSGNIHFGQEMTDIHTITGSLEITGSITASLFGTASYALTASYTNIPSVIAFACSDESTIFTASNAVFTYYQPYNMTISKVNASLNYSSSAGSCSIDILKNNSTIFTNYLVISQSNYTGSLIPVSKSLSENDRIQIDVKGVGTGNAGLKLYIIGG